MLLPSIPLASCLCLCAGDYENRASYAHIWKFIRSTRVPSVVVHPSVHSECRTQDAGQETLLHCQRSDENRSVSLTNARTTNGIYKATNCWIDYHLHCCCSWKYNEGWHWKAVITNARNCAAAIGAPQHAASQQHPHPHVTPQTTHRHTHT